MSPISSVINSIPLVLHPTLHTSNYLDKYRPTKMAMMRTVTTAQKNQQMCVFRRFLRCWASSQESELGFFPSASHAWIHACHLQSTVNNIRTSGSRVGWGRRLRCWTTRTGRRSRCKLEMQFFFLSMDCEGKATPEGRVTDICHPGSGGKMML